MQELFPICHDTVNPYIGRRVSAVTHDGNHIIGTIKGVVDGKLVLEDCMIDRKPVQVSALRSGEHSKKQTRSNHKARISGYYDGYGGDFDGYGGGYGGGCGGGCGGFGGGCFFFPFAIFA